jgi:hypothetical protein
MNHLKTSLCLIVILNFAHLVIAQSGPTSGRALKMKAVGNPAAPGSSNSRLTVTPDGRALLSWLEPAGAKGRVLKFAAQEKSGWSAPRIVASGRPFLTHDSVQPVVTLLGDDSLIAFWTENRQLRADDPAKQVWDAVDIYFSVSRDGGGTWTTPAVLHRDMSDCEHSYLSVAPLADDRIAAVWLDGRDKTYAVRHSILKIGLKASAKTASEPGEEIALDTDVCTCCPTAMARTDEGLIVAYRDHTGETRDISYVRLAQGRWGEPRPLQPDGWKINGCPVNGVDLDADGRRVAAVWFTAAGGPEVEIAFSTDAGESFGAPVRPVRVDEGRPIGRAAVALMPGGAVVAWIEKSEKQSRLLARYVGADGKLGAPVLIGQSAKSYPRLARLGDQAMITWTAAGSARTAMLSIQAISTTK